MENKSRSHSGFCLATLAVIALASSVIESAATITQQAWLKDSDPRKSEYFGWSTAVSGDTVVVGAPYELGEGSLRAGAAYVYLRNGTNWILQASLKASNADPNDWFGYSVAISGDTIIVGALSESSNATGVNGDQNDNSARNSGAAYVFVRNGTNWTQQAYLKASNAEGSPTAANGDLFGFSVGASGDTVVVGAQWEESNATGVNGNQNDNSARASGAAYVFVRTGTNWTQEAYLKASNAQAGDHFGNSVAVSDDTVVVGARREASAARGVNGDQSDNSAFDAGAAYVFARSGTNWTQQAYLKASNTEAESRNYEPGFPPHDEPGDNFGWAVAVSRDTVVVGAYGENSNAIGANGNESDNSAPDSGAAYVFTRSGTNWTQQAYLKASNTQAGARFGVAVGVSGDTVVVGAHFENSIAYASGAAYVFAGRETGWTHLAHLKASSAWWNSRLGWAVAISGDILVAGALGENSNTHGVIDETVNFITDFRDSGAAYVFVVAPPPDLDGDGVPDNLDQCSGTVPGAIVDARGCSLEQLVPCHGPWRNHGEYIQALRDVVSSFLSQGLFTEEQVTAILRGGMKSECGKGR